VLGFPSNDFKGQEPGDEKQIQDFCTLTYGVKFPMFEKVHVVGAEATPLYQRLTAATGVAPAGISTSTWSAAMARSSPSSPAR
jgi:glutathione peroxidase